jgi:phage tail tape-measure protein
MKVLSSKELNDVTGANIFTDFLEVAYPTTQGAADAAILGSAGMIIGRPVGAVIGGALGAIAGPGGAMIGTLIGGKAGSAIGSVIGASIGKPLGEYSANQALNPN